MEIKKWFINKRKELEARKNDTNGLLDAVNIAIMLGVIVIAGLIVIFIADRTNTAIGTINATTSPNLSAAQTSILSVAQTGYSFIIILVIAFIGSVAIGYVFGLLPGQRK